MKYSTYLLSLVHYYPKFQNSGVENGAGIEYVDGGKHNYTFPSHPPLQLRCLLLS